MTVIRYSQGQADIHSAGTTMMSRAAVEEAAGQRGGAGASTVPPVLLGSRCHRRQLLLSRLQLLLVAPHPLLGLRQLVQLLQQRGGVGARPSCQQPCSG